ncbi:MAG: acyl carrier protein [Victivallales bacterium]
MPAKNMPKITKIIKNISKNRSVAPDVKLLDSGVLDSLMTMKLIEMLEKEFKVSIPNDEFTHFNFNTIKAMSELVDRLSAKESKKK